MKHITLLGVFTLIISFLSCGNRSSDPNNDSQQVYDSLSVAGDTIVQHKNSFGTAVRQMMNDMNQLPLTGDPDRDFALLLKSHHQGGIDLAQAQLRIGTDNALKDVAQQIVQTQKPEVESLQAYLDSIKTGPFRSRPGNEDLNSGFNKIIKDHKAMMWDMSKMDTSMTPDHYFVAVMVPHFQSGIFLAEGYLSHGQSTQLQQLARETIRKQRQHTDRFQEWSNKNKRKSD